MTEPDQPLRVDWWQIIEDLRRTGLNVTAIADAVGIPKSTLLGYRNLDAEPKYADGEALIALWRARMVPPVPVKPGSVRTRRVDVRPRRMGGPSRLW